MAELMPHNKGRVPGYWTIPKNESVDHTEVPHPFAGNFPSDTVYATGTEGVDLENFPLDPDGGVPGPILPATDITVAAPGTAPAAGKYTPSNAVAPYDLAEMNALSTASGDDFGQITTWTTGQFIVLGDGSVCHWSSVTSWTVGEAP